MKATSKFLSAASAVALSAGLIAPAAVAVQFAYVSPAAAAVVSKISVEGNQRVDDQTIIGYLDITPGKSFSGSDVDDAVKRLFGTGLFSDVRINQRGSTLVVQVAEYSIVNQVLFQGNKKIKDKQLADVVQLKPRSPYSQDAVNADIDAMHTAWFKAVTLTVAPGTTALLASRTVPPIVPRASCAGPELSRITARNIAQAKTRISLVAEFIKFLLVN